MTIRAKKSTSAAKLDSVAEGETIYILEYGKEWTKVEKDGKTGYVLTKNVVDLALAGDYDDMAQAQYLGVASKALTIREKQSKSALKMQSLEVPVRMPWSLRQRSWQNRKSHRKCGLLRPFLPWTW